jgi:hypothetical protein
LVGDGSFLVEDFINAITAQLDRVQDALRLKAVNRPLTYALKDLALDLQVFVEMDGQGNVRFRTSGPNETGSSTVRLSFTTITKPMIEENTVSLAMTRSPSLREIGLDEEEQKRLEQIGVRNAAQLERLGQSTGTRAVARLSGIPTDRLRAALSQSRPQLTQVKPEPPKTQSPPATTTPPPAAVEPPRAQHRPPIAVKPKLTVEPPPVRHTPRSPVTGIPAEQIRASAPAAQPIPPVTAAQPVGQISKEVIRVAPNTRRLQFFGANLIGEAGAPQVFLNNQALGLAEAEDDRLVVELPEELLGGALEIELPDGQQLTFELSVTEGADPWSPLGAQASSPLGAQASSPLGAQASSPLGAQASSPAAL